MMIKEQVKALWKICFDDSEEFVEMYFRLRYKTEVNVGLRQRRVRSCLRRFRFGRGIH